MSVRAAVMVIVAVKAVLIGLAARRWHAIAAGEPVTMHNMCGGWFIWVLAAVAGVVAAGALVVRSASSQHRLR
jgi:hypothetical protein